jgi:hypothetical protein
MIEITPQSYPLMLDVEGKAYLVIGWWGDVTGRDGLWPVVVRADAPSRPAKLKPETVGEYSLPTSWS